MLNNIRVYEAIPLVPSDFWQDYLLNNFYYSNGHVYRKDRAKPIGTINNQGYRIVRLGPVRGRNEKINFKLHILVWFLYWKIWPTGELDHLDGNRSNNFIENLEVVSRYENLTRRRRRGTVSENEPF